MAFWDFFISPELKTLRAIDERTAKMALDLSRLTKEVTEIKDAAGSAKVLIQQIADALRATDGDQGAVNQLADQLDTAGNDLSDAVAANTPGVTPAPAPSPQPEPAPAGDGG